MIIAVPQNHYQAASHDDARHHQLVSLLAVITALLLIVYQRNSGKESAACSVTAVTPLSREILGLFPAARAKLYQAGLITACA